LATKYRGNLENCPIFLNIGCKRYAEHTGASVKRSCNKRFEEEDAKGIALNALNRNYKDKNHKPEVMVALSEFWLLHGFCRKINC